MSNSNEFMQSVKFTDPTKLTESIKERVEGEYFIHIIKRNL